MNEIDKLKDAIFHCKEIEKGECTNIYCAKDHKQLRLWLEHLLFIKETTRIYEEIKNSKIKKTGVLSVSDAILNQKYDLVSEVFVHIGVFRVRSHACEKGFSIFSSDLLFRGLTGNYL